MSFSCPTEPLKDFMLLLRRKAVEERIPLSCNFALTHRCSFRCQHCYLGDQHSIRGHLAEELSTSEVLTILDQLIEAGTLFLTLTGGDPLLREDFAEIYSHAVQNGLLVTVFCNGSLIDETIISLWQKYPPHAVEVSMYGDTASTFEKVTQTKGSFDCFQRGIDRLHLAGINYRLKTVLLKCNWHELDQMENRADDLGVHFRYDSMVLPCMPSNDNNGCSNIAEYVPDRDTGVSLPEVMVEDRNNQDAHKITASSLAPLNLRLSGMQIATIDFAAEHRRQSYFLKDREHVIVQNTGLLYTCGAGRYTCHISPYGKLAPCVVSPGPTGDLRKYSLQWAWDNAFNWLFQEEFTAADICYECKWKQVCVACPSLFALETGNHRLPSPEICEIAQQRFIHLYKMKVDEELHHVENTC